MAVKIKLKRLGKIRAPYYRIIVSDARTKRDGRAIEEIGKYAPKEEPSYIEVQSERVQHWLSVGAQPTEPVRAILEKTGDWQQFKGKTPPKPLKVPEVKPDKKTVFEAAAKEAQESADQSGSGQRGKGAKGSKGATDKAGKDGGGAEAKKSGTAKDSAAKDSAAKDSAAKDSAAKEKGAESSADQTQGEPAKSEG